MSYCRFGPDSDLYVVGVGDGYQCINCKLMPDEYASWSAKTRMTLFAHLMEHQDCGDKVPLSAIKRITEELAKIPQEHWDTEFHKLMTKLAAPNNALRDFMWSVHDANRKRIDELMTEFTNALAEMDNLDWPSNDD